MKHVPNFLRITETKRDKPYTTPEQHGRSDVIYLSGEYSRIAKRLLVVLRWAHIRDLVRVPVCLVG